MTVCVTLSKSAITAASSSFLHLNLAEIKPFKIKLVHAFIHFLSNQTELPVNREVHLQV